MQVFEDLQLCLVQPSEKDITCTDRTQRLRDGQLKHDTTSCKYGTTFTQSRSLLQRHRQRVLACLTYIMTVKLNCNFDPAYMPAGLTSPGGRSAAT